MARSVITLIGGAALICNSVGCQNSLPSARVLNSDNHFKAQLPSIVERLNEKPETRDAKWIFHVSFGPNDFGRVKSNEKSFPWGLVSQNFFSNDVPPQDLPYPYIIYERAADDDSNLGTIQYRYNQAYQAVDNMTALFGGETRARENLKNVLLIGSGGSHGASELDFFNQELERRLGKALDVVIIADGIRRPFFFSMTNFENANLSSIRMNYFQIHDFFSGSGIHDFENFEVQSIDHQDLAEESRSFGRTLQDSLIRANSPTEPRTNGWKLSRYGQFIAAFGELQDLSSRDKAAIDELILKNLRSDDIVLVTMAIMQVDSQRLDIIGTHYVEFLERVLDSKSNLDLSLLFYPFNHLEVISDDAFLNVMKHLEGSRDPRTLAVFLKAISDGIQSPDDHHRARSKNYSDRNRSRHVQILKELISHFSEEVRTIHGIVLKKYLSLFLRSLTICEDSAPLVRDLLVELSHSPLQNQSQRLLVEALVLAASEKMDLYASAFEQLTQSPDDHLSLLAVKFLSNHREERRP